VIAEATAGDDAAAAEANAEPAAPTANTPEAQ
jgi:hypothetical protein